MQGVDLFKGGRLVSNGLIGQPQSVKVRINSYNNANGLVSDKDRDSMPQYIRSALLYK